MATTYSEKINAEIRAELARQQIRQGEIAVLLGMTPQALSLRMTGKQDWKVEEVARIANRLGVPSSQLIPDLIAS